MTKQVNEILKYLKTNGDKLDTEIAKDLKWPLAKTHQQLAELAAAGEIVTCHTIRYDKGHPTEGYSCRLAGFTPKAAPGRKSKVQLKI